MVVLQEKPSFEALVYTTNRFVAASCARAFADMPIDWSLIDDPRKVAECAHSGRYDFLLIDLDSPLGTTLLTLADDEKRRMVLFGITQGGIDADILEMSYESLIFYPVRIDGLVSELHRAMPLAERMGQRPAPRPIAQPEPAPESAGSHSTLRLPVPRGWTSLARNFVERLRAIDFSQPSRYLLSIVWQERVSSSIAAAGAIWYIHEITRDWSKWAFLLPPTPGPAELIGVAVLLWLCAKHRRVSQVILRPAEVPVEDPRA